MPKRSEFVDYLLELLAPLGGVSAKAMFGGYSIYQDGLMFGLVADDVLYLKTDDGNRAAFEARAAAFHLRAQRQTGHRDVLPPCAGRRAGGKRRTMPLGARCVRRRTTQFNISHAT